MLEMIHIKMFVVLIFAVSFDLWFFNGWRTSGWSIWSITGIWRARYDWL